MCSFVVLFSFPLLVTAYYISPNALSHISANEFCQSQCNSNLSIFHNFEDYTNAISTIKHITFMQQHVHTNNIWINIGHQLINNISNTNQSNFEPKTNCIILSSSLNYMLQSTNCSDKHLFLCDSCDLVINKYVIISTEMMNYSQSNVKCYTEFGTTLASIHSANDHNEAKLLCSLATNTENTEHESCWIGLDDINNEAEYQWMDNTTLDFGNNISGGVYPWNNLVLKQPNSYNENIDCVDLWQNKQYNIDSFDFNDDNCNNIQPFVCNLPSAICDKNVWFSTDDNWVFDEHHCDLYHYYDENKANNSELLMNVVDKKWEYVVAEYTFALLDVNKNNINGYSGINIHLLDINSYFDQLQDTDVFSVGFMISNSTNIKLFISYNGSLLNSTDITDIYTMSNFYALKVFMTDEEVVKVHINDVFYMQHKIHLVNIPQKYIISGFGIQNNKLWAHYKSFYISGKQISLTQSIQTPQITQSTAGGNDEDTDSIQLSATLPPKYTQTNQTVAKHSTKNDKLSHLITISFRDLLLLLAATSGAMCLLSCILCCCISYIKTLFVRYSMKQKVDHMKNHHEAMHIAQNSSVDITLEIENVLQKQETKELQILSDITENDQYSKIELNEDECAGRMSSFDEYVTKGSQILNILNIPLPKTPNNISSEREYNQYIARKRNGYNIISADNIEMGISDVSDVFGSTFKKETGSDIFEEMNQESSENQNYNEKTSSVFV